MDRPLTHQETDRTPAWCLIVVVLSALLGLGLMLDQAYANSATYDEVTYVRLAAEWWKTGRSDSISRMGSPQTFFKLQTTPLFLILEAIGHGQSIDPSVNRIPSLLMWVRGGALWVWLIAFGLTAYWSRMIYGPRAMSAAAILFAISPNLLAHGSLLTMEMPLVACTTAMLMTFWRFLETGSRRAWLASALIGGLAFSCKFTTVVFPPILGATWLIDLRFRQQSSWARSLWTVTSGMAVYVCALLLANLAVTGFSMMPLSERVGEHPAVPGFLGKLVEIPIPSDWVGFLTQLKHQSNGGPSYLFGERRLTGWWYYYPVALAVKVPLACLLLFGARCFAIRKTPSIQHDWILPFVIALFIGIAMLGSKRNYGVRYLLPLAPLAIVWISALAERSRFWQRFLAVALVGQAIALGTIHPNELVFFNAIAGGSKGGRRILADSNLDWGQGLRSLAEIQHEYHPLTVFYFGDIAPEVYGVKADCYWINANRIDRPLPTNSGTWRRYVAVSASLQFGPWGPEGYFEELDRMDPVAFTSDGTIAIYDLTRKN